MYNLLNSQTLSQKEWLLSRENCVAQIQSGEVSSKHDYYNSGAFKRFVTQELGYQGNLPSRSVFYEAMKAADVLVATQDAASPLAASPDSLSSEESSDQHETSSEVAVEPSDCTEQPESASQPSPSSVCGFIGIRPNQTVHVILPRNKNRLDTGVASAQPSETMPDSTVPQKHKFRLGAFDPKAGQQKPIIDRLLGYGVVATSTVVRGLLFGAAIATRGVSEFLFRLSA